MPDVREVLSKIKSIEPLPQVCMRVMELSASENVVPRELIGVIHTDAGITAKVLKLCNSAFYGFAREISSLQEAGNMLGVNALVNLVLTACSGRYFRDYGGSSSERLQQLWENSVANALSASILARVQGTTDKNRAYTAGLLQNIGSLVIERHFPREALEADALVANGSELLEAERSLLGIDHAEIGARLAMAWEFPETLVDTIRHHHAPENSTVDPMMTSLVHIGEGVTEAMQIGEGLEPLAFRLLDATLGLAGLDRTGFQAMEDVLQMELDRARDFVEA